MGKPSIDFSRMGGFRPLPNGVVYIFAITSGALDFAKHKPLFCMVGSDENAFRADRRDH